MAEWKSFIIRLDDEGDFFVALRDGAVQKTVCVSVAEHFEYRVADEICRRIRERGYYFAAVCDAFGAPVTVTMMEAARPVSESAVREHWDDKLTDIDWEITRAVTAGEDPQALATRLKITMKELSAKMSDAISALRSDDW